MGGTPSRAAEKTVVVCIADAATSRRSRPPARPARTSPWTKRGGALTIRSIASGARHKNTHPTHKDAAQKGSRGDRSRSLETRANGWHVDFARGRGRKARPPCWWDGRGAGYPRPQFRSNCTGLEHLNAAGPPVWIRSGAWMKLGRPPIDLLPSGRGIDLGVRLPGHTYQICDTSCTRM